jgi:hypothetical protein
MTWMLIGRSAGQALLDGGGAPGVVERFGIGVDGHDGRLRAVSNHVHPVPIAVRDLIHLDDGECL